MEYLTIYQVAEMLQVTTRAIRKWVAADKFPVPIRLSKKKVLYDKAEIKEWLNERKLKSRDDVIE